LNADFETAFSPNLKSTNYKPDSSRIGAPRDGAGLNQENCLWSHERKLQKEPKIFWNKHEKVHDVALLKVRLMPERFA
jgi:hypothetical protein